MVYTVVAKPVVRLDLLRRLEKWHIEVLQHLQVFVNLASLVELTRLVEAL